MSDRPVDPAATAVTAAAIDARLAELCPRAIAVPRAVAFQLLSIKKTFGDELLAQGILHRVKLGKLSQVTVELIRACLISGIAPKSERPPPIRSGHFPKKARTPEPGAAHRLIARPRE